MTKDTDMTEQTEVTQADREAAVDVLDTLLQATDPEMISPEQAETLIQEAFSRHRIAALATHPSDDELLREAREELMHAASITGNLNWQCDLNKLVARIDARLNGEG